MLVVLLSGAIGVGVQQRADPSRLVSRGTQPVFMHVEHCCSVT